MVYELVAFGGVIFWIIVAGFCLFEFSMLYHGENATGISGAVAFLIFTACLVGGLPSLTWHWLAAYLGGAFAWVPIYWYLHLRSNHRQLLRCTTDHERYRCGTSRIPESGLSKDAYWLPKHPDGSALVANGLMWPLAAPVYLANDWISWVVALFSGLMDKIQASLAVKVTND